MEEFDGERTNIVILTDKYRIFGRIYLLPDARLTDFMEDAKEFIAVTDAKVRDSVGRFLFETSFLNINKNSIVLIAPETATNFKE